MKNLIIVRHGKAEDHSFSKSDFGRDLTSSGIEKSNRIVQEIIQRIDLKGKILLISSSATRAIETCRLYAEALSYPLELIQVEDSIYEAYYMDILKVINQVHDSIDTLFIFGHNPGLSSLVGYLSEQEAYLKTSAAAHLNIESGLNFSHLSAGTAHLKTVFE